jgi:hypothetical protein
VIYIERSSDHRYTFDGVTYPGTTDVLKVMDKSDALMAWASRLTAEAAIDLGPALVTLVETTGRQGAIRALTNRSDWQRDTAASIGSRIHDYADQLVRGVSFGPWPADVEKRVIAYAEWWEKSGWRLRASEALLVNPGKGYGGTLDLLCYDPDGRTVLADLKTGGRIYREVMLQLAAYAGATWMDAGDGRLYAMPRVDRHVVLHCTEAGVREIEIAVGDAERRAFGACIELHAWREATKGRKL